MARLRPTRSPVSAPKPPSAWEPTRSARAVVRGAVQMRSSKHGLGVKSQVEEQLRKHGVRVVYQRIPTDDTPEGQLLKHQLLSFAEFERAKTTLRTTMGRRAKARTGRVVGNGGTPPYGHRFVRETLDNGQQRVVGLEPDPLSAPVAVRIVRMARQASTWQIADALAAEGLPTPAGGRWTSKAVHRIATDPTHVGRWRFADITVPVQPLLAEPDQRTPTAAWLADWNAAQQALAERVPGRRPALKEAEDPYLLRGLLSCGHCGSVLRAQPNRGTRYYLCGRHAPSRARRLGKPACGLPDVPAADLEAEAWRVLTETLLDPDVLAAGLAAARSTRDDADRVRRDRLATIEAEIAKQRRTLDALADRLTTGEGGEFFDAILRRAKEVESVIAQLIRERDTSAAVGGAGLSDTEAAAVVRFAETARLGLDAATPAERRTLYELLRLRGRVLHNPDGVRLGRRNRFRIDWEAAIPLLTDAARFLKRDDP